MSPETNNKTAVNRPCFSPARAGAVAREHWGVDGHATELPSDRDQNFRIESADRCCVLKVARAGESEEMLRLQNDAAALTRDAGVPVAELLPARDGSCIVSAAADDGRTHLIRLVTWISGEPLAATRRHSPQLLKHIGREIARLDIALGPLDGDVPPDFRWNQKNAAGVFASCAGLIECDQVPLFARFVRRFEAIGPQLATLRESWIHNDVNDHNVLVHSTPGQQSVAAILDFGDLTYSWLISEIAIACAYVVLDKPNPLQAATAVVAGYHSVHPLEERELAVLFDLMCVRLCTSVAVCAEQKRAEPENEYLRVSEAPAWRTLDRLARIHSDFATAAFRAACGFEPCPRHDEIVAWLDRVDCHAVTAADCSPEAAWVHDLSVSSTEPAAFGGGDAVEFDRLLAAERHRFGKRVGIGRYDEPRLCYAAPQFGVSASQQRTVHLGLDVFESAGTRVFAPLDGTVHSLADNDKPLDYGPTIILRHETDAGAEFFTLYGHLSRESLVDLTPGQRVSRGECIATFGHADVNGGWPPHLHFQIITNLLGGQGDFPGVAPPDERDLWLSFSPDPNLITRLRLPVRCPRSNADDLVSQRRRHLGPSLSLSYRQPLTIVRGAGQFLYDDCGRAFLDTVNNVAHVGHCHPRVVEAGRRQMSALNTNTRYLHESILRYAERLTATMPEGLDVCFFVCSGSEANELAMRMAATFTGSDELLVLDSGYHGNSAACVAASAYKFDGPGGTGPARHIHKVPTPDVYRRPEFVDPARATADIAEVPARSGARSVSFLVEALPGCGGQIVPPQGYLSTAFEHVRASGGVCIADEVQTGFGRVGSHFWAFETQGVVPDIVTLGKPIGNGHPIGAVVTTREIAETFANGMEYFNTFGGNAVSCEIGLAVLDVLEDEGLQARALETGTYLRERLTELANQFSVIGDVRGLGLFLGIEFVRDRQSKEPAADVAVYVTERLKDNYILASTDGPLHNVIKIKPPLVFCKADAERYWRTLSTILASCPRR